MTKYYMSNVINNNINVPTYSKINIISPLESWVWERETKIFIINKLKDKWPRSDAIVLVLKHTLVVLAKF